MIRDQRPMSPKALAGCLVGIEPPGWYKLLNGKVFFWADPSRLGAILRTYQHEDQELLVIDTLALLERHACRIGLSHINSGAVGRAHAQRGPEIFKSLGDFPREIWQEGKRAVAEVTLEEGLKSVEDFLDWRGNPKKF